MTNSFIKEYRPQLKRWCASLRETSGPLLAISRKGPRLLELVHREGLLAADELDRVTSERALAFPLLRSSSADVVTICDDICIYGSTFRRISSIATRIYGTTAVRSIPFAVSRIAGRIPTEAGRGFTIDPDNCTAFINTEVSSFASLSKPYDIEHPILYVALENRLHSSWLQHGLNQFAAAAGSMVYATTADADSPHPSWTLLLSNGAGGTGSLRKIRLYYDVASGCLALVPIAPRVATLDELNQEISKFQHTLCPIWRNILDSTVEVDVPESPEDSTTNLFPILRDRSLVCWANYLLELSELRVDLHRLRHELSRLGFLSEITPFELREFDISLLIDRYRAVELASALSTFVNDEAAEERTTARSHRSYQLKSQLPGPEKVYGGKPPENAIDYETAYGDLLPATPIAADVLESIFKAQHVAIDLPSRETAACDETRLEFGVPFGFLIEQVRANLGELATEEEINRALDILVDRGVIVPRYLHQDIDGEPVWYRSFRVGEGQSRVTGHVVKECFQALAVVLDAPMVGEVTVEKFFVLNCELRSIFSDASLSKARSITRGFHLYGARPRLKDPEDYKWMVEWACRMRILERIESGGKHFYQLHGSVASYYDGRTSENPLAPERRSEVSALARWTKEALVADGLGSPFLVAITTVESEWALAKALEAEIRGWIGHEHLGLAAVMFAFEDFTASESRETWTALNRKLEGLANWIAQSQIKLDLRERFDEMVGRANELWPSQYTDTGATWQNLIRPRLEARSADVAHPAGVVEGSFVPLLGVMRRLTTLLRNILSEYAAPHEQLGLFASGQANRLRRAKPAGESLAELIGEMKSLPFELRVDFDDACQEVAIVGLSGGLRDVVEAVRTPTLAIGDAVEGVLSRYSDLSETPLDYLPGGRYVLFWDVRGSTDLERIGLTRRIVEVNSEISKTFQDVDTRRLLEFDAESTDDGGAAVCDGAETAFAIARLVATRYKPDAVKIGCVMCREGMLLRVPTTGRLSGRGFEYCARIMNFFSEIERDPERWTDADGNAQGSAPGTPDKGSFFVLMGETYDHAKHIGAQADLAGFAELPGAYLPRVRGAVGGKVFLKRF